MNTLLMSGILLYCSAIFMELFMLSTGCLRVTNNVNVKFVQNSNNYCKVNFTPSLVQKKRESTSCNVLPNNSSWLQEKRKCPHLYFEYP